MKHLSIILLFLNYFHINAQDLKGLWQGFVTYEGQKYEEATLFYLEINDNKILNSYTREEVYNTTFYALQQINGTISENKVVFKQKVIEKKKSSSSFSWCSSSFEGTYNDSTGYISGTFLSHTCKRTQGKFILYRISGKIDKEDDTKFGHAWRDEFLKMLKDKQNAPEIREKERKSFVFEAVFFDHDEAIIKPQYHAYLKKMIRVVNGHSDLRIKATGHTDNVGSDAYNIDLSKRRVQAIKDFFEENNLELYKLVIDFKGEKEPIDNNQTPEGKQKNRRVDFAFI